MQPDYVLEYRKLRDAFRQARRGGCTNVESALNMISYNSNWQYLSIDEESSFTGNFNNSPLEFTSPTFEERDTRRGTDSDALKEKNLNSFASSKSRRPSGAAHLVDTSPTEVCPEYRPRKGHKKSRGGCFNCKKRKIKCQENQPACKNCSLKKLKCEYPSPRTLSALRSSFLYSPRPVTSVNLQSTPTVFTLTDMRLFHHYLLDAYPHLPVGNESAWLSQIPLIAHHNQYLMHAILGTAASHLEFLTGDDLSSIALHHRVRAIQGSSEALTQTNRAGSDGDALLAACYLLTFQSSYMKDAISEFFQFVRGCTLVSNQLREEKLPMAFFLASEDHFEFMEGKLLDLPVISNELLDSAEASLACVAPILELPAHVSIFELLIECIAAVRISSLQGYFKFLSIYQAVNLLDNEAFTTFLSPTNHISRILIGHFFAIQLIMLPILDREWGGRTKTTPYRMNLDWVPNINQGLPNHMRGLMEWPTIMADTMGEELSGASGIISKASNLRKKNRSTGDAVLGRKRKTTLS